MSLKDMRAHKPPETFDYPGPQAGAHPGSCQAGCIAQQYGMEARLKVSQIQAVWDDYRWSRPAGGREGQRLRGAAWRKARGSKAYGWPHMPVGAASTDQGAEAAGAPAAIWLRSYLTGHV